MFQIYTELMIEKRIDEALRFKNTYEGSIYLGLGGTNSWGGSDDPPRPSGYENVVENLFGLGYSKVDEGFETFVNCKFVVEDPDGDIDYRGNTYRLIDDDQIHNEDAHQIYLEVLLPIDEFISQDEYRQIGLFVDVVPETGYEDEDFLNHPDEVSDLGELYALSNMRPVFREGDKMEKIIFILEF